MSLFRGWVAGAPRDHGQHVVGYATVDHEVLTIDVACARTDQVMYGLPNVIGPADAPHGNQGFAPRFGVGVLVDRLGQRGLDHARAYRIGSNTFWPPLLCQLTTKHDECCFGRRVSAIARMRMQA